METSLKKTRLSNKFLAVSLYIFVLVSIVNLFGVLTKTEVVAEITSKISVPLEWVFVLWAGIRLYKVSDKYKALAVLLCLNVIVPLTLGILVMLQIIDLESLVRTIQINTTYSFINTLTGVAYVLIKLLGANVLYRLQ